MTDIRKTREQPIEQFFAITEEVAAGMLGVQGSGQHLQPMHPFVDRENRSIWFFAKRDSDIAKAAEKGTVATFIVIGKNHDYHASVHGTVRAGINEMARDRYWNSVTSAWFTEKHDPNLTMIELHPTEGVAWASTSNSLAFGWEILKSNLTDNEPDAGARKHFRFTSEPTTA